MSPPPRRLAVAFACSLLLHALPFVDALGPAPPPAPVPPPPALEARLLPPPAQPPLSLPEQPRPAKTEPPPKPTAPRQASATPPPGWQAEVKKQLRQLDAIGEFYPREAIAQGLEGEVLVLLILAEDGSVAAARVEQGSGHPILDAAALKAVRALRSLPADAPRETLLPVRFRLR